MIFSCNKINEIPKSNDSSNKIPNSKIKIGFLDIVEDATLAKAREGFVSALKENGYHDKNIDILFRNAQGDITTLTQAVDYFVSENVDLIATNSTICTITSVQRNKEIPVCMMVSPSPKNANLTDSLGNPPKNLFGIYETLDYIDTAVNLIPTILPSVKKIGAIYNQAEPQSQNALDKLKDKCKALNLELEVLPVNNSSEVMLVTETLLSKNIDVFALPDNVVFSSFETIAKSCNKAKVPIFTCEAGLVQRGAVAGFGADMYAWGHAAGLQAVEYLISKKLLPKPELLRKRQKMQNEEVAMLYNIKFDSNFIKVH